MRDPRHVLVVSGHTVLRAGIRHVLERTGEYRVVAEASSLSEAELRLGTVPDSTRMLITEVQLDPEWAFDLIRAARRGDRPLDVIVLTSCLRGFSDNDISRVTGRPAKAINREIGLLRRRLGVSSRAAAVTVALSRGMLA